jgi:hypothetical protein
MLLLIKKGKLFLHGGFHEVKTLDLYLKFFLVWNFDVSRARFSPLFLMEEVVFLPPSGKLL